MLSPTASPKSRRRVSFALSSSSDITKPNLRPESPSILKPPTNIGKNISNRKDKSNNNNNNINKDKRSSNNLPHTESPQSKTHPNSHSKPSEPSVQFDPLAGIFTHTVTNTPHGLVIDGVLQPRGAAAHSEIRNPPPNIHPQLFPYGTYNPSVLSNKDNMSTVGAGFMPDPNAVHYQPPVPDTTYGPYQYTYVPRSDMPGYPYMTAGGYAAGYASAGGPSFMAFPAGAYQQPHPGMATTPIPMMPSGGQPPIMAYPMQAPMTNMPPGVVPPGAMPPMACFPPAGGPTFMAPGVSQPTPPFTPPGTYFGGGGPGGGVEFGKTKAEVEAETQHQALHNQMNEPQSMKPADDDISRMYWCRELDGQWTSRSRFSLDRMGNFRWYVTENGVFYATMLPE